MSAFDEQTKLINDIMNGRTSYDKVKQTLEHIENEYGENSFIDYKAEKKEKPWTKDDLYKLYDLCIAGVSSKDIFLYMAEISDYLKIKKRNTVFIIIAAAIIAALIVTGLIIFFNKK